MGNPHIDVIAASARCVVPKALQCKPAAFATWATTRIEDDFDVPHVIEYLKREGYAAEERLLREYVQFQAKPIELQDIESAAPWIECLPITFIDYASFRQLRKIPKYVGILTFTTPAIAASGDLAFLEVWEEDGRYSEMGTWWWIQMRWTDAGWQPDWRCIHSIS